MILIKSMEQTNIFENYKKSLKQKYNAVCFDIDGTLTIQGSHKIDYRAIQMIANLLSRKIPVVLITGRGETGLIDLKKDIYLTLKNDFFLSKNDFKRFYVLTNDGARMFYSDKNIDMDILTENTYISDYNELKQLNDINLKIIDLIDKYKLNKICDITYSKDLKTDIILNIRIVFKSEASNEIVHVFETVKNYIKENNFESLKITRGLFKGKSVIQIGTATKDKAIAKVEKMIGVPKDSMIRVGDCGDVCGNDFAMLDCKQGYSVDKTSGKSDSCFPIFDNEGNILTGVDATLYLMKKVKLLTTVCLEKASKDEYTYKYAQIEKEIILERNKYLHIFNNIINANFNVINGINGLFDEFSGSIKIPMYEWILLKNSFFKNLWATNENDNLCYSIRDDNNYLLRGSKTYYYFLANRQSINDNDLTTKQNVLTWYINYLNFFSESLNAINLSDNLNEQINKKFILGILDNCRNVLLILINHMLVSKYNDENILLNLSIENNNAFCEIYNVLLIIENLMANLCFNVNFIFNKEEIFNAVKNTCFVLKKDFEVFKDSPDKGNYSKEFRTYREIDNFAENYITVCLYNEKNNNLNNSVCGLSYGGIELPLISKVINDNYIDNVLILKFNKCVSGYANKQLLDLRNFNIYDFGGIEGLDKLNTSNIDLFDDNVLTGKTLQLAINSLYDCGISVNNICIVRYPSVNRIDQMFMKGHSAVDFKLFFDYINGLCFNSPYSWRDHNKNNSYEDSLGVFDLNRKKIIECLLKNHDYMELSEVGNFGRRLVK